MQFTHMTKLTVLIAIALSILAGCNGSIQKRGICDEHSEWRDNNGPDSCSYYTKDESCKKLIGKLQIKSRLHKGALENGVFEGGMSSRWLEITKNSIIYYTPNGEISDKGDCVCSEGILKIEWEKGDNLPDEATIYFNSQDFVELRYYDFPFSFSTLQYDTLSEPNNPTKIVGTIK